MSLRRAMQTENWAIFSAEKQNQALRAIRRHMVQVDRLNKYLVATKLDGDPIKLRRFTELTIRSVVRHILKLDAIVISLENRGRHVRRAGNRPRQLREHRSGPTRRPPALQKVRCQPAGAVRPMSSRLEQYRRDPLAFFSDLKIRTQTGVCQFSKVMIHFSGSDSRPWLRQCSHRQRATAGDWAPLVECNKGV